MNKRIWKAGQDLRRAQVCIKAAELVVEHGIQYAAHIAERAQQVLDAIDAEAMPVEADR